MQYLMTLYTALLFFVLVPGVLVTIPPKGSKMVQALVHGLVFALVYHYTHKMVYRVLYENFQGAAAPACGEGKPACPPGAVCMNGVCASPPAPAPPAPAHM
jgi:hypothetical protein